MAKAKKPAAKKTSGTPRRKPTGTSSASKAAATSSAATSDDVVSKSTTSAPAKATTDKSTTNKSSADKASTAVSPSEIKKELEAKAQPTPTVAKEAPGPVTPKAEEKAPAPETAKTTPAPVQHQERRSIFWPLVLGGLIAGILGFLASELDLIGDRAQTEKLRASLTDQSARLEALESVEPPVIPEMPEVTFPALDDLTAEVTQLATTLDDLDARLTVVEKQPIASGGTSEAAIAAYERELAALQESVETQRAEIEGLLDNALSVEEATAEVARTARIQGALTDVANAIGAGQPFAASLNALAENGVGDVPAELSDAAADGVQTLNALQTRFPDSARASLGAARSSGANDAESGFGGFLKRQLGARSVTPRDGDDPDAVLSRAEAAMSEGRLNDALSELNALPEPAQEAMQEWLDDARSRQAAQAALQDLSQSLSAN